jgi:hypothetical protein
MAEIFYTVAVHYKCTPIDEGAVYPGNSLQIYRLQNMTAAALKTFRENIFIGGLYKSLDADTGFVIPPWNITHIEVYRQSHFFKPYELNKNLRKNE